MNEAGDIVFISVPFFAGICVGALISSASFLTFNALGLISGISLPLCVALTLIGRRKGLVLSSAFFAAGLFAFTSAYLRGSLEFSIPLAEKGLDILKKTIYSIPYEDSSTSGIVTALLTGDKSGVSRTILRAFREAGAAHILALSGLHLGVIYLIVKRAFSFLGNSPMALCIRCAIVCSLCLWYALMTGMGPSITRALFFIMISEWVHLRAERSCSGGRKYLLALTLQLALSPLSILSASFQLSYLAMAGIIFLYPEIKEWHSGGPLTGWIWNSAALSLSCQVFTAPLCWILWGSFPLFFLLTNLIAVPLSSAVMFSSLAAITLQATTGASPPWLTELSEFFVQTLVRALEIIASL